MCQYGLILRYECLETRNGMPILYAKSLIRPHFFPLDSFLPEVPAHGAVDDEVEAGVEGDEQGGDAGGGNSIESQQLFYQVFTPEWDTTMHKIFFNQGISCVKISC